MGRLRRSVLDARQQQAGKHLQHDTPTEFVDQLLKNAWCLRQPFHLLLQGSRHIQVCRRTDTLTLEFDKLMAAGAALRPGTS